MARGRKAAVVETGPVEGPWDLPEGWRWEPLGSLAEFVNGAAFKPTDWVDEGIPIVRIQNLTDPYKPLNRTLRNPGQRYRIASGDLLVSWSATLDAFVWKRGDAWLNQHIFKVIPEPKRADADFLFYLLKHEIENLKKSEHLHGSTMKHINRGPFLAHVVPVPPLDTQRCIVARIDELFSELDDGEAALARARANLETYRKSLLKAAVTGELTADWRAANPPTETGEQLLQRILADRRARWEADPKNKGKRYKEPEAADTSELAELPEGWTWASLAQVADISPKTEMPGTGIVTFIPMAAVEAESGKVSILERREAKSVQSGFTRFQSGDVIFAKITPCMENGKIAIVPDLPENVGAGSTEFHVIRPHLVPAKYIWTYLVQPTLREDAERNMTGTAGQRRVPRSYLELLAIPLPPLAEQEAILATVGDIGADLATKIAEFERLGRSCASLRQSILAAAFRGELVQ